jgi:hypothetical protein
VNRHRWLSPLLSKPVNGSITKVGWTLL